MSKQAFLPCTLAALALSVLVVPLPAAAGDDAFTPLLAMYVGQTVGAGPDAVRCPTPRGSPGPALRIDIVSAGHGTIVGTSSVLQSHCIDPNGPHPSAITNGQAVTRDADGDLLYQSYAAEQYATPSSANDQIFMAQGEGCNNGGTGKYQHARGCFLVVGQVNLSSGATIVSLDGLLRLGH